MHQYFENNINLKLENEVSTIHLFFKISEATITTEITYVKTCGIHYVLRS